MGGTHPLRGMRGQLVPGKVIPGKVTLDSQDPNAHVDGALGTECKRRTKLATINPFPGLGSQFICNLHFSNYKPSAAWVGKRTAPTEGAGLGTTPQWVFWRGNDTSRCPECSEADSGFVVAADVISEKELKGCFVFQSVSETVSLSLSFVLIKKLILSENGCSKPQTANPGLLEGPFPGRCWRRVLGADWEMPGRLVQSTTELPNLICAGLLWGPGAGQRVARPVRGWPGDICGGGSSYRRQPSSSKNATVCAPKFYLPRARGRLTLG